MERPEIVYVDEHLAVIRKPHGFAVQPARQASLPDLVQWCASERDGFEVRVVHRLDARASGLVVMARSSEAAASLSKQFSDRAVRRVYTARLSDHLPVEEGEELTVDAPILRRGERGIVSDLGKIARTNFRVVKRGMNGDLVFATLDTGRFHQIRVHASHSACPIWGDVRYGGPRADRMYLHGATLQFTHPSGEVVAYQWELPWGP